MKKTDPIKEYKRMLRRSKALQNKLRKILESTLSHNYGDTRDPVSFDIYRFIDSLVSKGFPSEKISMKIVEKGYICTISTRAGYDVVIRHDHNWKAHVHFMADYCDYRISYYDESHIADVILAVDDLGEKHKAEMDRIYASLKAFHATPPEAVSYAYHARFVSDDRNYRIAAVDRIVNTMISILADAGHKAELSGKICPYYEAAGKNCFYYRDAVRYDICYDDNLFSMICDPSSSFSDMEFRFKSDCRYIDSDIEFCASQKFKYGTPENIASYIEKLYSFINHLCYKEKHVTEEWKPICDGTLEMVCYCAVLWEYGDLEIIDAQNIPKSLNELVREFDKAVNDELSRYLAILDDFKYTGHVHIEKIKESSRLGSCYGKGSSAKIVMENSLPFWFSPDLIREVLLHELCHTRHISHSRIFWHTLEDMLCRVGIIPEDERRLRLLCPDLYGNAVKVLPRTKTMHLCMEYFHFVYSRQKQRPVYVQQA